MEMKVTIIIIIIIAKVTIITMMKATVMSIIAKITIIAIIAEITIIMMMMMVKIIMIMMRVKILIITLISMTTIIIAKEINLIKKLNGHHRDLHLLNLNFQHQLYLRNKSFFKDWKRKREREERKLLDI